MLNELRLEMPGRGDAILMRWRDHPPLVSFWFEGQRMPIFCSLTRYRDGVASVREAADLSEVRWDGIEYHLPRTGSVELAPRPKSGRSGFAWHAFRPASSDAQHWQLVTRRGGYGVFRIEITLEFDLADRVVWFFEHSSFSSD